jgi:drug/metabolite transporter (DMT)-like permease
LVVAGGAFLIGLAPIGMRLSELGPQATGFWRFVFALPLLALLFALKPAAPAKRLPILLIAGFCFGLDIAFWHAALGMTTVANATLATNMTPIVAAVAGWFLFKEPVTRGWIAGAAIAFTGAIALSYARSMSHDEALAGERGLLGDLFGLVSCFWYASYLIILRMERPHTSTRAVMLVTTLGAAFLSLGAAIVMGEQLIPHTLRGWAVLVGLGIVVHVAGQGLIAYGVGRLPIALSTVLLWVQPIAAAAFSWMLFDEALAPLAFAGAALVLAGVWLVQRQGNRQ